MGLTDAITHTQTEVEDLKIIIGDHEYSLDSWQRYHPGGKLILQQYNGKDGTDAFYAFHSQESIDKLEKMKRESITPPEVDPATADYRQLRKELQAEGLFETIGFGVHIRSLVLGYLYC